MQMVALFYELPHFFYFPLGYPNDTLFDRNIIIAVK